MNVGVLLINIILSKLLLIYKKGLPAIILQALDIDKDRW